MLSRPNSNGDFMIPPALIPFVLKIGDKIYDRVAGTKKARVTSSAGATMAVATVAIDPGALLSDEYSTAINAIAYLIAFGLMLYREKHG